MMALATLCGLTLSPSFAEQLAGRIFPATLAAQVFAAKPMRLAVKAVQTTLPVGSKGQFWITFLDRKYQTTANDTKRRIEIKPDPMSSGTIEISQTVEAFPGQREVPVVFTPKKPGRVLIHISSQGLVSSSVLFTIAGAKKSAASLLPTSWAQDAPKLGFYVLKDQVPANGTSSVRFLVTLDRSYPTQTEVQMESDPRCTLLYAGENRRHSNSSLTIVIRPQEETSLEVRAQTSQPGAVQISAHALPQGPSSETTFTFIAPRPASLDFDEMPLSIPLSGEAILRIHVADQDNISVKPRSGSWNVSFKPSGNAGTIQLEPDRVVLSGQTPMREVFIRATAIPLNEKLVVYASTEDGSLQTAEKELGFDTRIGQLNVIAPTEVNLGASTKVTVQFLLKDQPREAATEFQRQVEFDSDRGSFEPDKVIVNKGETSASSVFVGHQLGQANLHISTLGVDVVERPVLISVALGQLVLIALAAGTIGGLVRFFYYREQSWDILPQKTSRGWNPGLVGNAAFSGVFGVVMLLMVRYGLVQLALEQQNLGASTVSLVHTTGGAFLLGIAGGFAGVAVLELLAKRLGLADALVLREKRSRTRASRPAR